MKFESLTGQCNCGTLKYEISGEPLFTHVCHCRECQRDSGGAFNVSMLVLVDDFRFVDCEPNSQTISRPSGNEYEVWDCENCGCTIGGISTAPSKVMVVRPGTLNNTSRIQPQAHIWIAEKQGWVDIPDNVPAFDYEYDAATMWSASSLQRLEIASSSTRNDRDAGIKA